MSNKLPGSVLSKPKT